MTAEDSTTRNSIESTLAAILDKVETIDDNVREVLDQLGEHLDNARFSASWYEHGYTGDETAP